MHMSGRDDGEMGVFKEALAMLTMGLIMAWCVARVGLCMPVVCVRACVRFNLLVTYIYIHIRSAPPFLLVSTPPKTKTNTRYYLVVIISLLCLAGLCFPSTRIAGATAFVLLWGTNLFKLDYQGA